MFIIVERYTLWRNWAVYTLTFGIKLKCRHFYLFFSAYKHSFQLWHQIWLCLCIHHCLSLANGWVHYRFDLSSWRGGRVYCSDNGGVEGFIVDMSIIVEESTLWLNQAVYTFTFGIKSKCRLFCLFFCIHTFISMLTYISRHIWLFYMLTIV